MSEISDQEFKLGYWVFQHRSGLRRAAIGLLVVVIAVGWGYSGIKLVSYLARSKAHDEMLRLLVETTVETRGWKTKNRPQPIEVTRAEAVAFGRTYDLVATVKNPNLRWSAAVVNYTFLVDGVKQASGTSFLLPLEEKFFFSSNIALGALPRQVVAVIDEISWQRVRDWRTFPQLNFAVSGQELADLAAESSGQVTGTRLRFNLTNGSAYSFWQVRVQVALVSGQRLVAVASKDLSKVDTGETRSVEFIWPTAIAGVTSVVVKPEVNVLDSSVFKPL